MKIIKKLSEFIDEEIDDAKKYAENAAIYKDSDPDLSEMFHELSEEELGHASKLHDHVVKAINAVKESGKTIPPGMMEIYDYLHKRQIERVNEVKVMLAD